MAKDLNIQFKKENVAVEHMTKCSISLILRDMQIKTTMIYQYIPNGMSALKKTDIVSVGENVEKTEPSCINTFGAVTLGNNLIFS